jgi:hypothetical protein
MMAKYEAVVDVTIEVDAENEALADKLIKGELINRLLETASRDNLFKMWLDVRQIDELEEREE